MKSMYEIIFFARAHSTKAAFPSAFAASHAVSLNPCLAIFPVIKYSKSRSAFCKFAHEQHLDTGSRRFFYSPLGTTISFRADGSTVEPLNHGNLAAARGIPRCSPAQTCDLPISEFDTVGEDAQYEIIERVGEIGAFAAHLL